jgi:uncharacterized protein
MDKTDAIKIVQDYARIINLSLGLNRVILFGSYARGNFSEDSDIDIAVIFKEYKKDIDIQLELMRLRRQIDSRIEPHPFRESEFNITNPIVNEIVKYGQEISGYTG